MKKTENICHCCHEYISDKDSYWITKENSYQLLHCMNCIKEKGIMEFYPYLKPRKKREKVETTKEKNTIRKKKEK